MNNFFLRPWARGPVFSGEEEGNKGGAVEYFNQEKLLFPESEKYVALALKEMEGQ
jgi:hypothetical protein